MKEQKTINTSSLLGSIIMRSLLCFAFLGITLTANAGVDAGGYGSRIDEFARAEIQRQRIPGVSVAVIHKGEVVRAAGYGFANLEHQVPVKPETIFQSGSVGKQFTSALVMTLVEEGKLGLSDPIGKHLKGAPKSWSGITIRHLLTHTSGIPDWTDGILELTKDYSEDELVKIASRLKPEFAPGARWNYSNTGYVLLGIIVSKVSGTFYGDLMKTRIFEPLGMHTARVINEHDIIAHRSSGYELVKEELKNQQWVSPTLNTTADGSLYFSILDLIAWEKGLRAGAILKPESWAQMYEPVKLNSGNTYPYGFAWFVKGEYGQKVRQHGGAWQGFRTNIVRYLGDDLSIIVLANGGMADTKKFTDGIAGLFNAALTSAKLAPIADAEPQVTARLKTLLADLSEGGLKPKDSVYVSAGLLKAMNEYYGGLLKGKGELKSLELLKREPLGDEVVYEYRAHYADAVFGVELTASPGMKFSALSLSDETKSTLIKNANLIDGSGAQAKRADVRIAKGRISAIGTLTANAEDTVFDAQGLTLAPGFIDTHSHHDDGLEKQRGALAAVSQGISTIIAGQDGYSPMPLAQRFKQFEATPGAVNLASYTGHGSIRAKVMGTNYKRKASAQELDRMRALLRKEMQAGALGLSTGLEYDPGIYSAESEVLELAKVAAADQGRYISHVRSEDRKFWEALDELIEIGRVTGMPVQVSHIKLAMRQLWGRGDELIARLDRARAAGVKVTADSYPYTMWQSSLTVLYPERNFSDRTETEFILKDVASPDDLLIGTYEPQPSYEGKTVREIAALRETDPATTLMALIAGAGAKNQAESVVATGMDERDIATILRWPHTNICSDGELDGPHPRGFGSFPRVLARYVREQKVLPLEEAIRKMTSLPAANAGLQKRGTIAVGNFADLVLFDPATIMDHATVKEPHAVSTGVDTLWVNGQIVFAKGAATGRYPGQVLRRGK